MISEKPLQIIEFTHDVGNFWWFCKNKNKRNFFKFSCIELWKTVIFQ